MEFRVVIWNLKGLSQKSETSRLQRAKEAFRLLADEKTAVFALVELAPNPDTILEDLAAHLGNEWTHYYGAVRGGHSEIGLLLNTKRLSSAAPLALETNPSYETGKEIDMGREPAVVYQVYHNNLPSFILAIVHFKAERGGSEYYIRKSQAAWLRGELEKLVGNNLSPVVIVGDFNGEPWEEMFKEDGFRAFRRVDAALRSKQDALQLYNPMWRLLPDPIRVAIGRANNNQKGMPYGTFPTEIWHSLIDGVLVSGEWLRDNSGCILHDERLEILTDDLWHHIGKQGAHHARPVDVDSALAITDHLPIAVNLEVI